MSWALVDNWMFKAQVYPKCIHFHHFTFTVHPIYLIKIILSETAPNLVGCLFLHFLLCGFFFSTALLNYTPEALFFFMFV